MPYYQINIVHMDYFQAQYFLPILLHKLTFLYNHQPITPIHAKNRIFARYQAQ